MSATASLEALINELFIAHGSKLRAQLKDFEVEFWGKRGIERKPILDKYQHALAMLCEAVEGGFFCYPGIVRDPWFDPLRTNPEFILISGRARERHEKALVAFNEVGGREIVGIRR